MARLFEALNPMLFKPLAGRYKERFADLLDIIWERCKNTKDYSMEKEAMTELAERYFEGFSTPMELEEDDEIAVSGETEPTRLIKEPHEQALWALNRLRTTGWLEDQDGGYGEAMRTVVVPGTVPILQAFREVLRPQTVTYSGKLFKANQLFKTLGQDESPYENILKEVSSSMDELNTALRNLNASIGKYIEKMTRNKTPQEVLALFEEYEEKIVVAAYHRFKTSDNLFRYRMDLQNALDQCEDEYLDALVEDYCRVEQVEPEEGLPGVLRLLQKVHNDLETMSDLMREIDRNHLNYRKRAVQRAQFMLLTDSTIQGTINELLKYYARTMQEEMDPEEEDDSPLSRHWNLYSVEILGKDFLKSPVQPRKKTDIEPLSIPDKLSEEELWEEQEQLLAYARAAVTQENVNLFAKKALQGKNEIKASEIPLERPEEIAKVIALHTYSKTKNCAYDIALQTNWVHCGGLRFQEFLLKKKV